MVFNALIIDDFDLCERHGCAACTSDAWHICAACEPRLAGVCPVCRGVFVARGEEGASGAIHLPARPFADRAQLYALLEGDAEAAAALRRGHRAHYLAELREAREEARASDPPQPPPPPGEAHDTRAPDPPPPPLATGDPALPPLRADDDDDDDEGEGDETDVARRYNWTLRASAGFPGAGGRDGAMARGHVELHRIGAHDGYRVHFDDDFLRSQPAHNPAATLLLGRDVFGSCLLTRGELRPFDERTGLYHFPPAEEVREMTLREATDVIWSRRDAGWDVRALARIGHMARFLTRHAAAAGAPAVGPAVSPLAAPRASPGATPAAPQQTRAMAVALVAARELHEALENDVYPEEMGEGVYEHAVRTARSAALFLGIRVVGRAVSQVVYNAWKTLLLHGRIDQAEIAGAIIAGELPAYFERAVRALPDHARSAATSQLVEENLFDQIEWDEAVLTGIRRGHLAAVQFGSVTSPRSHERPGEFVAGL